MYMEFNIFTISEFQIKIIKNLVRPNTSLNRTVLLSLMGVRIKQVSLYLITSFYYIKSYQKFKYLPKNQ